MILVRDFKSLSHALSDNVTVCYRASQISKLQKRLKFVALP